METLEARRLTALRAFEVVDTPPEEAFDRLTALASDLFKTPFSLVTFVDAERQWMKSAHGAEPFAIPREFSLCAHAITYADDVMVIEDCASDPRVADNPAVTGKPGIRFYAGAVLRTRDGHALGTLCVLDTRPRRRPTKAKLDRLRVLAKIVIDELELRRATRVLMEKQRLLDMAESMSDVGCWRLDVASGRVDWSDAVYRIHGVTRHTFDPNLGDAIAFYHPDDRAHVSACIAQAIAGKNSFDFQLRLVLPKGRQRHVISRASCEMDRQGNVSALFGLVQDVTEQVESLQAVQSSQARYKLLAENGRDLILHADNDGLLTYISPSVFGTIGYEPDEMIGRSLLEWIHPDDRSRLDVFVRQLFADRGKTPPRDVEYRVLHKDGREFWLEGTPTLAVDPVSGRIVGVTDVVRDITHRKASEEALRKARADAEAAAEVKSQFLANMSHELRTPLTAVLGFAKLVEDQAELSPITRDYMARVSSGGRALLSTINDILDFSKLEADQVEIKPRAVSPASLAGEVIDLFALQAEEKGVALRVMGLDRLPEAVEVDPDRVRQILLNLLGNAVKFTQAGSVSLAMEYDAQAERLTFAVKDTGPGIPDDQMGRLFQRFSQVDGSSTRKFGGTGLGLAISKGLVDAMGGHLGVQSAPGGGSCFWFAVPARLCQTETDIGGVQPAATLPAGCRVLVADDNAVNRALVRAVLSPFDLQITEVEDGAQAVTACAAEPFDVILMDLRMPVMDGLGATCCIRMGEGPNARAPIIAFSADVTLAMAGGLFDGLVAKPLSAENLVAVMAWVIQTRGAAQSAIAA